MSLHKRGCCRRVYVVGFGIGVRNASVLVILRVSNNIIGHRVKLRQQCISVNELTGQVTFSIL
ncbi:hypothetical protein D3C85_893240 [compost metagenome]